MTKNKVKELSYYLFFGFMIFAKGIGLDSGDRLYYLLSAAACACAVCKLVLTKYNRKEITAMAFLCIIAFAAYKNSGRMGILLSTLTIVGLKDMNLKKLFRLGTAIYGVSFVLTVIAAKTGLINNPMVVHEKGGTEVIRWGMGYSTGNIFHVSYFILVVFLCYTWGKHINIKRFAVLAAGNFLTFLFSLSYTGVIITFFYLFLNLYAVKRKKFGTAEKILCQLPLPFCLLFSFGAPLLLKYPVIQKLDGMLQARLTFSAYYLKNQPITLLGARMEDVPNFWVIMDNGYVYFLMTFGILAFALLCAGYAVIIAGYSGICVKPGETKSARPPKRLPELAVIFSFLLYGIMEQFISNAFMNVSLLFLGEALFGNLSQTEVQEKEADGNCQRKRKKEGLCLLFGVGIGACVLGVYLVAVPMKTYVSIPLDSLPYVKAQSVQIQAVNADSSKETIKGAMAECRNMMEEKENLAEAIRSAGTQDRLSEEELKAAMEYSLPVYVHNSKIYDTFRVRILQLYQDITDEEYRLMLEKLTETMQTEDGGKYMQKNAILGERIGKSFGEDRIEHISGEKEYLIEKSGNIVRMEYIRNGICCALLGMLAGMTCSKVLVSRGN